MPLKSYSESYSRWLGGHRATADSAEWRRAGNQVWGKIPNAFPLATACVRLLMPSFP